MREETECLDLRNQIYCMDCMELMAHIPDNFVSLILTDPPYGIAYQNHFARQPHEILDGDQGIDYERFAWESYRILRDNSHAYFFTRFDCYSFHYDCLRKAGFTLQIVLMKIQGYSTHEIARYLKITEKAIYRRMDRLKEKIKKYFNMRGN